MGRPVAALALTSAALLVLAGCSGSSDAIADPPSASPTETGVVDRPWPTAAPPSTATAPSPNAETPAATSPSPTPEPDPVSLPALMQTDYNGGDLQQGAVLNRTDAFTAYSVTYRSADLRISGVLYVPDGAGPFPGVVLNHGYIDPDVYVTGQGLGIEADYLARSGFVVLHTDYRNHAASDDDPDNDLRLRLGYTEDTINAVRALRSSGLESLDPARIGMLGRSMGGGVTLNALVVDPRVVDAAVIYASVSSNTVDNHEKWTRGGRPDLADAIEDAYGSPEENPEFWANVSPRTFVDRVRVPVLVHHGTADETCPIEWADATVEALRAVEADVTYLRYPGEGHAFSAAWAGSMAESVEFLRANLR
jgi:dipeptidyl aminopeptidase/acylaminoacyl peptidase